jgi:hypothetical protein
MAATAASILACASATRSLTSSWSSLIFTMSQVPEIGDTIGGVGGVDGALSPGAIASAWEWILLVVRPQQRRRNAGRAG